MDNQVFLVDGSSYIYRAYHGIRDLAASNGLPTNAVYGFASMLLKLIHENRPPHLAIVFDPPRGNTFRTQLYPEYKANRQETPEDLIIQIPYIKQMVKALGIRSFELPGYEADDVLATLARRFADEGASVTLVTGDKDLMQVVNEHITLLDTMKEKRSGIAEVHERFGVAPERVTDVLGLAGDTSDNIPGVPGIGEKIASELVQRFGSLEQVLKWSHLLKGKKRKENLSTFADQARLSKKLATVKDDLPFNISLKELKPGSHTEDLLPLLKKLEFENLSALFTPPAPGVVEIYSDGSGSGQGPGGYGVVLRYGSTEKELSGFEPQTTSQRMELLGAIRGLEALKRSCRVRLVSDSQYLVRGMNEWLERWEKQGRLETPDALKNQDLWKRLLHLSKQHTITWQWVRGHNGHPFNERADALASQAVQNEQALPDGSEVDEQTPSGAPSTVPAC